MQSNFGYVTNLQYEVKRLKAVEAAFLSGKKYQDMKAQHEKELREKDRVIAHLKRELARSQRENDP